MAVSSPTVSATGVNTFLALTPDQLQQLISAAIDSKSSSSSSSWTRYQQLVKVEMDSDAEKYFSNLIRKYLYQVNYLEFNTFEQIRVYYEENHRKMKKSFKKKIQSTRIFWDLTNPDKQDVFIYHIRKFVLNILYDYKVINVWDIANVFVGWFPEFEHKDIKRKINDICRSFAAFGLITFKQIGSTKKKRSMGYKCRVYRLKEAPDELFDTIEANYKKYQHGFLEYKPDSEDIIEEKVSTRKIAAEVDNQLYNDEEYKAKVQDTNKKKKSMNKQVETGDESCVKCSIIAIRLYKPDGTIYCAEHHDDISGKAIQIDEGVWTIYKEEDFEKIR